MPEEGSVARCQCSAMFGDGPWCRLGVPVWNMLSSFGKLMFQNEKAGATRILGDEQFVKLMLNVCNKGDVV